MEMIELSKELCQLHIKYAGVINQVLDGISAKGEDGVILWLSLREQDTYPTDITQHFRLTSGRVANILKRMEEKHWILRCPDQTDQRRSSISLTEDGRAYAERYYEEMVRQHLAVVEVIGERESIQLVELMKHMLQMIEQGQINPT